MNNMSVRHWRRVESYYHARRVSQWRTVRCVIARAEHALEGIFCVFAEDVCSLSLRAIHDLTIDYRCSSKSSASTS